MPTHMVYTLGTKEGIENMDLGKDWKFWIKCQKEYELSQGTYKVAMNSLKK